MFFVDSHCHLNFPDFKGNEEEIVNNAKHVGIERFLSACTRLSELPELIDLTRRFPEVVAYSG